MSRGGASFRRSMSDDTLRLPWRSEPSAGAADCMTFVTGWRQPSLGRLVTQRRDQLFFCP